MPNKTAKFFGKLSSFASSGSSNVHLLQFYANGVKIDSQVTDRYQRVLLEGSINTNSLVEGNNELRMTYEEHGGASNGAMLIDWVEAEYPQKIKADRRFSLFSV